MSDLPSYARELNELLMDYPADSGVMWLSQFDGFVAGLLVCPDTILLSTWLPVVMGRDESDQPDVSRSPEDRKLVDLLMTHYEATARALDNGTYAPIFDYRAATDETFWQIWMEGFIQAVVLSPGSWGKFEEADDELIPSAFTTMMILAAKADPEWLAEEEFEELSEEEKNEMIEIAPDLIQESVLTLCEWTRGSNDVFSPPDSDIVPKFMPTRAEKVCRNERCPCGSGKKYKKCCGPKDAEALAEFMRRGAA